METVSKPERKYRKPNGTHQKNIFKKNLMTLGSEMAK